MYSCNYWEVIIFSTATNADEENKMIRMNDGLIISLQNVKALSHRAIWVMMVKSLEEPIKCLTLAGAFKLHFGKQSKPRGPWHGIS